MVICMAGLGNKHWILSKQLRKQSQNIRQLIKVMRIEVSGPGLELGLEEPQSLALQLSEAEEEQLRAQPGAKAAWF